MTLLGALKEWTTRACHQSPVSPRRGRCSLNYEAIVRSVYNEGQCIQETRSGPSPKHGANKSRASVRRWSTARHKSGTGVPTSAHFVELGTSVSPSSEDDADCGGVWFGTGGGRTVSAPP
ncbi:hypothetical protein E2C01_060895 [Portunus trituberculatus]|uniref:Uncharacterized protein n=1 Tax=Portunus trituberculatus TaxID=210409 RepID=A0A5B7HDL2_PORTR|nr:hypothetical protein [Portunus trituberculatus]